MSKVINVYNILDFKYCLEMFDNKTESWVVLKKFTNYDLCFDFYNKFLKNNYVNGYYRIIKILDIDEVI